MARYGTFLYGSGQKYGTSPTNANLLWTFIVDWDNDGYFTGENEAEYMVDFSLSRGRDHLIAPNGQGFERYQAGKVSVTLDNSDGRFNPFNTSSPLYPYVTPGRTVRIAVKNGSTGTDYSLMRGKISDIQPYNVRGRKLVKIDVIDGQQFLADKTVRIGLRQTVSISPNLWSTGRLVDLILERANWPEDEWPRTYDLLTDYLGNLDSTFSENFYTTLAYAWFWNRNAMEAVRELENTELGTFLHDRNGNAQFLSQHKTYDNLIDIDESELLTDISLPQPWETLRNRIEIVVNPIQVEDLTPNPILWSIAGTDDQAIPIAAESSFVVDALFRYFNYTVVPGGPGGYAVEFTVNSLADGSGSNLTSQCTVQESEFGDGATITLLNNSVTDGFITQLRVSGDPIYGAFDSVMSAEDEDSIDIYSSRTLSIQSPWTQEPAYAQELADFLLEKLKDPTPFPVIKIEARPSLQFPLDLYVDAIHLIASSLSINKVYRIGKIEHDWLNDNGQAVLTTLKLEPYFAVDAPEILDCSLYSPFSAVAETAGTVTAPLMDWTLSGDWEHSELISGAEEIGYIRCPLSVEDVNDTAIANISYTVQANDVLSFWYRYGDTDGVDPEEIAMKFIADTADHENNYSGSVPFVAAQNSGWLQFVGDFPPWMVGETVTTLKFFREFGFVVADANFYLDSVCIGTRIS